MTSSNISNALCNTLGAYRANMYLNSAGMFSAIIESEVRNNYFVESSQFTCSTGEVMPREYHLKVIADNHVFKVLNLGQSKNKALETFKNLEFLKSGALVISRELVTRSIFDSECNHKYYAHNRLYDNGFTACFYCPFERYLLIWCEGDKTVIHCSKAHIFRIEKKAHLDFFRENEL